VEWINGLHQPLFATQHLTGEYPPAGAICRHRKRRTRRWVCPANRVTTSCGFVAKSGALFDGAGRSEQACQGRSSRSTTDPAWLIRRVARGYEKCRARTLVGGRSRGGGGIACAVAREHSCGLRILRGGNARLRRPRPWLKNWSGGVAQRTDQLRALVGRTSRPRKDRQRRQIARDLHDDLGQTLARGPHPAGPPYATTVATMSGYRRTRVGALIDRASGAYSLARITNCRPTCSMSWG